MSRTEEEKKEFKSKLLTAAVVVVLCLVFVVGFVWGLNSVLAMEGQFPPDGDTHGLLTEPKENGEVVEMLNTAVKGAIDGKPMTSIENDISIDDSAFEIDGSEGLKSTVKYVCGDFEDVIDERLGTSENGFGENSEIRIPEISAGDIETFECVYFSRNYNYACDVCDAESDELLNGCPECGSSNLYVKKTRDDYVVNVELKNTPEICESNFAPYSNEEIIKLLGDDFNGILNVEKLDVRNDDLKLSFHINRNTGELTYLEYKKDLTVSADVKFTEKFADLGNAKITFKLSETNRNNLTWPSLKLNEDELVIEPKASDNLTATLTCTDPTKPVVKWETSDENVVAIDEEGYMKAGKEPGEATVTATFEFNGKTYSDTCVIKVRVPVESMKMSKRKLTISQGESKELKATVSPGDATVQTVTWYTDDEKIATVDESGVVKAVSSGVVTVYALSDDGYFKSSCEVTVK